MPEQDEFDIAISQFQDRLRMTQAEVDQLR